MSFAAPPGFGVPQARPPAVDYYVPQEASFEAFKREKALRDARVEWNVHERKVREAAAQARAREQQRHLELQQAARAEKALIVVMHKRYAQLSASQRGVVGVRAELVEAPPLRASSGSVFS